MKKIPSYLNKYKKHGSPFTELFGLYNYDEEDLEHLGKDGLKMYNKLIKLLDSMTKDNYQKVLKKIYDMRNEACGDDGLFQACAYAWPAVAEEDGLDESTGKKLKEETLRDFDTYLSESYKDLDIEDVDLVVKRTIGDMSKYKDCTSTGEILEKMNEALSPYGFYLEDAEYVGPYDSYGNHLQWSTQHILYGTTRSNGLITAVVAAEDLLDDIENNYKVDWDEFMRDIITTFTHEYTHRYQLDKYPDLSGEYDNEYDYLTSNHEMAARAFAGVKELMQIGYTPKDLMRKIKSTSLDWMNESDQLSRLYDYLCCEEPNSKILRKFKKYVYEAISKYGLDEEIVKFPTKNSWHAVDLMSLILEIVSKNENVYDANTIDATIGHNPGVWFIVKSSSGEDYRFTVDCANDESYHMICQSDDNPHSLAEWTGKDLAEFTEDFNEAISLDWT